MVKALASPYLQTPKFQATNVQHVQDIITQKFEAQSRSDSTLRFTIRNVGPRALIGSDALLCVPMRLNVVSENNDAMEIAYRRDPTRDLGQGSFNAVAADGAELGEMNQSRFAANRNPGFCTRFSGLFRALESITLEVNGVPVSYKPSEWMQITDNFLYTDPYSFPEGCMDKGSNGEYVGRAYRLVARPGSDAASAPQIRLAEHEIDYGLAERCRIFRNKVVDRGGGEYDYTYVTKIPIPPFSYHKKGFGSASEGFIPYISTLTLTMTFKPNPQRFAAMFQCAALFSDPIDQSGTHLVPSENHVAAQGNYQVAQLTARQSVPGRLSTVSLIGDGLAMPFMAVRFVNPPATAQLRPSYSLSLPRYLVYRKTTTPVAPAGAQNNQRPASGITSVQGHEFRFFNLRLEALPNYLCIACSPKLFAGSEDIVANAAQLGKLRTCFQGVDYQDTFDPLFNGDEGSAVSLKIQVNEKSNLIATYTNRDLYRILRKNAPAYKHPYDVWLRSKFLVLLTPSDLPTPKMANEYYPTTLNISARFVASDYHIPRGDRVGQIQASQVGSEHEASLILYYEDSLTLSQNAAAASATLLSAGAISNSNEKVAPAIDGLAME